MHILDVSRHTSFRFCQNFGSTHTYLSFLGAMDIGDYLKEDYEVVDASLGDSTLSRRNDIKIDRHYQSVVQENREVSLALDKRFKGKRTFYDVPGYRDLVYLCLCSDGYKVSSSSLRNVSDDDVALAWQFIDTTSVSSTARCREIVNAGKSNRNGAGFLRSTKRHSGNSVQPRRARGEAVPGGPPAVLAGTRHYNTEHNRIYDVMLEDCMRWITRSKDPVKSAALLRSNILRDR